VAKPAQPPTGEAPAPNGSRGPAPLAAVLDDSCQLIRSALEAGQHPTELHVSPTVYDSVAAARPAEAASGLPLMVLGLRLVCDASLDAEETSIR
jgi:hypothetical protein